jgi:hypothetical protein
MRRLPLIAAAAVWPLAAVAEEVPIRSGEHAGFSRLVLEFDERPQWSLRVAEGRATVVLGPGERSFRTGDVFARIPRTRIRAVAAHAEGLELELGCDCTVTAFEVRGAALAIDVSDPASAPDVLRNVTSTAATGTEADGTTPPPAVVAAPLPIRAPDVAAGRPGGSLAVTGGPARLPLAALPVAPEPDGEPARPGGGAIHGRVLSDLTEAIARATTQGNLRLADTAQEEGAVAPEALLADPAAANLRLRLPGEDEWLPEEPPQGMNCRDEASYDVGAWVPGDLTPAEAIAALQASLAPDLDSIDEERAIALARLYVGFGFGAEARAVLAALAPRHPEAALLEEMALIVDGEPVRSDILAAEAACPGRAQLWAALASGEPGEARDVIVAVSELPVTLRRQLAPRVMSNLIAEGDASAAEAVRGTVERTEGPHGAPFALAAAQMEAQRDQDPDLATVRDLAGGSAPSADEALAVMLEVSRGQDEVPDSALLARAETRADDLRGTALGTRLEIGLIHAYLHAADFNRAAPWFATVMEAEAPPPGGGAPLARDFFSALGQRGTDEDLLVHAARFEGRASDLVRLEPSGAAIAARLLDLGFPGLALRYLPERPADPETLELGARARLLSGDPEGALALLDGADPRDPDRALVRDEALRALGRADEAEVTPVASAPDPFADAANPGAETTAEETGARAAAGTARALVQASEEARQRIDALLATAPAP